MYENDPTNFVGFKRTKLADEPKENKVEMRFAC